MDQIAQNYYEQRERAERAAAKRAANAQARRVHQQLAARYAQLADKPRDVVLHVEDDTKVPPFVILHN
jgi:plasmid stabilization system protein ParE